MTSSTEDPKQTVTERRAAQVAHVLARALRNEEVVASDALRILRHELRRLNTNRALKIPTRSVGAQAVVDQYGEASVPKNGSPDALHADHVHPVTEEALHTVTTVAGWLDELARVRTVVCVTAAENYRLQKIEQQGTTGPEKYAMAEVAFTTDKLPWATPSDAAGQ